MVKEAFISVVEKKTCLFEHIRWYSADRLGIRDLLTSIPQPRTWNRWVGRWKAVRLE